jgi:hypothetical protein
MVDERKIAARWRCAQIAGPGWNVFFTNETNASSSTHSVIFISVATYSSHRRAIAQDAACRFGMPESIFGTSWSGVA